MFAAAIAVELVLLLLLGLCARFGWARLRERPFFLVQETKQAWRPLATIGAVSLAALVPVAILSYPILPSFGGRPLDVTVTGPVTVLSKNLTDAVPRWKCSQSGGDMTCTGVLLVDRNDRELLVMDYDLHWTTLKADQVRLGRPQPH